MQLTVVVSLLALAIPAFAQQQRATFDTAYDNAAGSTLTVSCSDGPNGLAGRFPTFGSFPTFPNIGGAAGVSFGSSLCGSCWNLTDPDTGVSIIFTAIDHAGSGFNIAEAALNTLTNGNAVFDGSAPVNAVQLASSVCGI